MMMMVMMKSDAGREQISSSTCEGPPAEVNSGQQEGQAQGSGVKRACKRQQFCTILTLNEEISEFSE